MELWMIVLLVLVGVILVFFLVASGIRFYANSITTWFNIRKIRFEGTISDHTRALLDMNGLADVQVRTTGFFSSMFVGNTYKVSTKTVRLSWLTSRRATPTNLAIACKLVALAKLHRENVSGLGQRCGKSLDERASHSLFAADRCRAHHRPDLFGRYRDRDTDLFSLCIRHFACFTDHIYRICARRVQGSRRRRAYPCHDGTARCRRG